MYFHHFYIYTIRSEDNWKLFSHNSGPPYPSRRTYLSGCVMTKKVERPQKSQFGERFYQNELLFSPIPHLPPFIPTGSTKFASEKLPRVCAHPPASPYPVVCLFLCPLPLPHPRRRSPYSTRRLSSSATGRAHGGVWHAWPTSTRWRCERSRAASSTPTGRSFVLSTRRRPENSPRLRRCLRRARWRSGGVVMLAVGGAGAPRDCVGHQVAVCTPAWGHYCCNKLSSVRAGSCCYGCRRDPDQAISQSTLAHPTLISLQRY
jgi:hypothetical protein